MTGEKPEYVLTLERLRDDGSFEKLDEMIQNKTEVWIKRSSGKWQKGNIVSLGHGGLSVEVIWPHPDKPGKFKGKNVETVDFLQWQKEDHDEEK